MIHMNMYLFAVTRRKKTQWHFRHLSFVSKGYDSIEIADAEAGKYRKNYLDSSH